MRFAATVFAIVFLFLGGLVLGGALMSAGLWYFGFPVLVLAITAGVVTVERTT